MLVIWKTTYKKSTTKSDVILFFQSAIVTAISLGSFQISFKGGSMPLLG